ncbi:MAG: hypothetical protein IT246_05220 [Bacteroidia bacterium]|nr:hypothetical protein [Bacteroidia bacterium]
MRYIFVLSILIFTSAGAQVTFEQKATDVGRLKLALSNAGTIGRPTVSKSTQGLPSMAFPQKGNEHLFESGIWIGAKVNNQVLVSTSAADATSGYSTGGSGFEFSPLSPITERSKNTSSPMFSASAVSHQDFVMYFSDSATTVPGTTLPINGHSNPLYASVKLETYAWNYAFADFFVICNYTITNNSTNRWDSVWVGQWSDLVVKNVYVTRQTGSNFFNKGRNGVDYKNKAIYAWLADKSADDIEYINSYGAIQFLGIDYRGLFFNPEKPDTFINSGLPAPRLNYNFWNFSTSGDGVPPWKTPTSEQDRYDRLKTNTDSVKIFGDNGPSNGIANNWIQLLSAGPLISVEPGESFTYTVAFVAANRIEDGSPIVRNGKVSTPATREQLTSHFVRARATYLGEDVNEDGKYRPENDVNGNGKLDRYILPEPPKTPKTKIISKEGKVEIYWDNSSMESIDPVSRKKDFEGYRLYRTNPGDDLSGNLLDKKNLIAQWDSAGNDIGYNNGFAAITLNTPITFEGDSTTYTHKYEMSGLQSGWQYLFILTAFDKGNVELNIESLESSYLENAFSVFTGANAQAITENGNNRVGVYPNPYYGTAAWDGNTSRSKKIYFTNLPAKCTINIYTSSGDLVANLRHDASTYTGEDSQWFDRYGQTGKKIFSGGEHAWDILSNTKGAISSGVYLVVVKDETTGNVDIGKFAIIK